MITPLNQEPVEDNAVATGFSEPFADERSDARSLDARDDSWLISRIRLDPPDPHALDELVRRFWKGLYGRCHLLTLNPEKARDLAQEAWCRVLRARRSLKADGNFPAYLATVATNLWRDSQRHSRRAGPLADHRLASLQATPANPDEEAFALADAVPDLQSQRSEEVARLRMDIDAALERLTPMLRDVLVARFIAGESCAEIGHRYSRTEQTVSGWVREAVRQMKLHLEDQSGVAAGTRVMRIKLQRARVAFSGFASEA